VVITKNLALAAAPGNVLLPASVSSLPLDSVINVLQLMTIDKLLLTEGVSQPPAQIMTNVEAGLRLVTGL
jgi:mRNA interferase MazF